MGQGTFRIGMTVAVFAAALAVADLPGCASSQNAPNIDERPRQRTRKKPRRAPLPAPIASAEAAASDDAAEDSTAMVQPPTGTPRPLSAEHGLASFYADMLAGNRTASGERYRPDDSTCAHRKHKFGTRLLVTNVDNGKSAVCRVNDRGPFVDGRVVDVSRAVADQLDMRKRGVVRVQLEVVVHNDGS
jgi:rare lipoprotein A